VKKKIELLKPAAKRARQKLKALTGRKTHYSLDTEFGVLTVQDAPENAAIPRKNANGKPRR
jgi:hypothetical protein